MRASRKAGRRSSNPLTILFSWISAWSVILFCCNVRVKVHFDLLDETTAPRLLNSEKDKVPVNALSLYNTERKRHDSERQRQIGIAEAMLEEYRMKHSVDTLRQESLEQLANRKYAMGYFSCPLQAGNRLHHFANSLIWAIVTNRTLLYKYYDKDTCEYHQSVQTQIWMDNRTCSALNTESDCEAVLERASWLPLYDEWSEKLQWGPLESKAKIVDYWGLHDYDLSVWWRKQRFPVSNHSAVTRAEIVTDQLVDFPAMINKEKSLLPAKERRRILHQSHSLRAARLLHKSGVEFLYGLIYTKILPLKDGQRSDASQNPVPSSFSVALHSRHIHARQNGLNIEEEKRCLNELLSRRSLNSTDTSCTICIMSDRVLTVKALTEWLRTEHHCLALSVDHSSHKLDESNVSFTTEHGPNAGVGFLRDVDLCKQYGKNGFIGTSKGSSSSGVLEELVEYENNKAQPDNPSQTLKCTLIRN